MKKLLSLACMLSYAVPSMACVPPPGLSPQQWYAMCGRDMEVGFARGVGGKQSHDQFMMSMYRMYQSARPFYNPQLERQQQQLAHTMASGHQQYMNSVNRQRDARNQAFADQQREKAWRQNEELNYIRNEHCAVWNTAHTYCLRVPD